MANSIISATDLLGDRIIEGLKTKLPMLGILATDMRADRAAYGATISNFSLAAPAVNTYSQATGYDTTGDLTQTALSLTLNTIQYTKVKVTDLEASSSNPGHLEAILARHADLASYALAKGVVDAGIAKCTIANFSNVIGSPVATAPDYNYDAHLEGATTLREDSVPGPYWSILNARAAQGLRGDATLINNDTNPGNQVVTSGGLPPNVAGVNTYEYSAMTTPSGEKLIGIMGSGDGLIFGNRLITDATFVVDGLTPHGVIREHTDVEGTGLSIQSRMWYDMKLAEAYLVFAIMYGWAVGDASRLYRIVHQ